MTSLSMHVSVGRRAGTALLLALLAGAWPLGAQNLLVPMDDSQQNHLKAYGLTFGALKDGQKAELFLNFVCKRFVERR